LKNKPKLLQRPVLIKSGKAVIGRPPDDIKSII
jgi:arsenate reductase-like glutaredoxin family protein